MRKSDIQSLAWLLENPGSWGAHLVRGTELNDPRMVKWLRDGLIRVDESGTGYDVTPAGRAALRAQGEGV